MIQDPQKLILKILDLYLSDGHISQTTIDKFREWFAQEGDQETKYSALEAIFNEIVQEDTKRSKDVEKSFEKFCKKFGIPEIDEETHTKDKQKFSFHSINIWYRVAAVILPALMVSVALYKNYNSDNIELDVILSQLSDKKFETLVYSSDSVQVQSYMLPDSTSIKLNGNSVIAYHDNPNGNVRHVEMTGGEAYIKVNKQAGRLFVVEVDKLKATVRGTTFSISALSYKSYVRISLFEGLLDVEYDGHIYSLVAGQELVFTKATGQVEIDRLPSTIPHWMIEELKFENMTSAEILNQIAKIYNVIIECPDTTLLNETLTMRFEEDIPLDNLLLFLSRMSVKFSCTHTGDTIIVNPKKT